LTEHGTAQATRVTLSLVIPVFNEEDSLDAFILRIDEVFRQQTSIALELVFVNDGSTDATLEGLLERQRHDSRLRIVDLSRNFGKEAVVRWPADRHRADRCPHRCRPAGPARSHSANDRALARRL
jgi:cellulose synthase/poly-beta-1,6-N-acetylglucosamine synthase-like glycosyltransferase